MSSKGLHRYLGGGLLPQPRLIPTPSSPFPALREHPVLAVHASGSAKDGRRGAPASAPAVRKAVAAALARVGLGSPASLMADQWTTVLGGHRAVFSLRSRAAELFGQCAFLPESEWRGGAIGDEQEVGCPISPPRWRLVTDWPALLHGLLLPPTAPGVPPRRRPAPAVGPPLLVNVHSGLSAPPTAAAGAAPH